VEQQATPKDANYLHIYAYKPRSLKNKASVIYSYNSFFQTYVPDCAQLVPQGCTAYLTAVLPNADVLLPCSKQSQVNSHVTAIRPWADPLAVLHAGHQVFKGGSAADASWLPQHLDAWWHYCTSTALGRHHCIIKA
jgi:hypothetical protein